jgi:nucleoside 2-deoxyribosyltransferase
MAWRKAASQTLRGEVLDPMARDYRGKEDQSVDAIVNGDLADIEACDVVLVNATRPSWGTAMEMVYAHQKGKLVVAFTEGSRVSPWLRYHCKHIFGWLPDVVYFLNERAKA